MQVFHVGVLSRYWLLLNRCLCYNVYPWEDRQLLVSGGLLVREITVKISDIVHCVYYVEFMTWRCINHRYRISDRGTMSGKILYILQRFRNPRNRISDRCTTSEKILYILQRFRNLRNRISDRCTMSEKVLYLLQRFSNPRHRNCDRCTMAGTYSIYYRGTMYPPPSHLRRRIAKSGRDAMLAG